MEPEPDPGTVEVPAGRVLRCGGNQGPVVGRRVSVGRI
jgi:hypothetical protein